MNLDLTGRRKPKPKMTLRVTSPSQSVNESNSRCVGNIDHCGTDDASTKYRKYQNMTMLAENVEGQNWEQPSEVMATMEATTFRPCISEITPKTGAYPVSKLEPPSSPVTAGRVTGTSRSNRRSVQQEQASLQYPHSMNATISQSTNNGVNTTRGTVTAFSSFSVVPAAAQQLHPILRNSATTNETMIPSAYSAFTQPVYGPSVEAKHPQFIDIATNTGYMTPFELPEVNASVPESGSQPVSALRAGLKKGNYTTILDRISIDDGFEEPSEAVASQNGITSANSHSAYCYPSSQVLLSAPASAPRLALWPQRAASPQPQPTTHFSETPHERYYQGSGGVETKSKEGSVAIGEKDNHIPTHTGMLSSTVTRSISPHPAPKRRGAGPGAEEMASGLILDGTPLHQTTKLRAGSHQQHSNASFLSFFMGMTASTKAVNTPMARDARGAYHFHAEGDENDIRVCLNSKLVTPQAQGLCLLHDDSNSNADAANAPTLARSLLTEPSSNVDNPKHAKEPVITTTTHRNRVMQKLLNHIETKKTFEHKSATHLTYPLAFSQEGVPFSTPTNFTSAAAYSVSELEVENDKKQGDSAVDFHAESSNLALTTGLNRQGSQRGGSCQNAGKESRQRPRQKHQRDKKANQNDAPRTRAPTQQENTPTDEIRDNEKVNTGRANDCGDDSKNAKWVGNINPNSIASCSLQPSLMDLINTPALEDTTDAFEQHPANLRCSLLYQQGLQQPESSAYHTKLSPSITSGAPPQASDENTSQLAPVASQQQFDKRRQTPSMASQQLDASAVDRRIYSVLLEGHMQRHFAASSYVLFERDACVLFEGDRGIDMGRVVKCEEADEKLGIAREVDPRDGNDKHKKTRIPPLVLRVATPEEQDDWLHKQVEEAQKAIQPCCEAAENLGLPLTIVNAVYQFNREKLTFYYESDVRVDFRQLLHTMFLKFHCRIWMERATPLPSAVAPGGEDCANSGKRISCHS